MNLAQLRLAGVALSLCVACSLSAADADSLARNIAAARQGNWETAYPALAEIAKSSAEPEQALLAQFWSGEAALQVGWTDKAQAHFGAFLKLGRSHSLAKLATFRYGEVSLQLKEYARASAALQDFCAKYPGDPLLAEAQLYRGQALLALGQTGEAASALNAGLAQQPRAALVPELRFELGRCAAAEGRWPEATAAFGELMRAGGIWAWPARVQLGRILHLQGQHQAAVATLTQVGWPVNNSWTGEAAYWTALSLQALDRHWQALELIDDTLGKHPELEGVDQLEYLAGLTWRQLGDRASASHRFRLALARNPQGPRSGEALQNLLELAQETRDRSLAESLTRALQARAANRLSR